MPFGLINTLTTFMMIINEFLRPLMGIFVIVFNDDVLVYIKTVGKHEIHSIAIFQALHEQLGPWASTQEI